MSSKYILGSQWRKWDLQVQTIIDDGYVSIESYADDLKAEHPLQWQELCTRIGSEDLVKKYDSKAYFSTDPNDDEKSRAKNYAKVFVNFLDVFNTEEVVVCITDHNYYHPFLIDALLKESKNTKVTVLPGIEINVSGVHMLVIFDKLAYGKTTYAESLKHFLSQIDVHNPKDNGVLTVSSASYTKVIDEVTKLRGLIIYSHCNNSNGLFQERGKTDRTHLAGHLYYDPRPFVTEHVKPLIPHGPDNGFPSDHALFTMTLTVITYFFNKKIASVMLILTIAVGAARVLAKAHSPLDIGSGWVLGIIGAVCGFYLMRWVFTIYVEHKKVT